MAEVRLQKYFTDCGVMSRRAAEEQIKLGHVKVNGRVAEIGCKIDPELDTVELDGKRVVPPKSITRGHTYILLNKPVGYVSTASDEKDRLTACDIVRNAGVRLYPVGRLDMYSDGLLIMTNDGELTNRLTHPSHGLTKTYIVHIIGELSEEDAERLGDPVDIDGYITKKAPSRLLGVSDGISMVEIVLSEGRNRQIRRMCESAGYKIKRLTRTKIGDIEIGDLPIGRWRKLTPDEIEYLKNI